MELGPDHLVVAKALNNLAVIYFMQVCTFRVCMGSKEMCVFTYIHSIYIIITYIILLLNVYIGGEQIGKYATYMYM